MRLIDADALVADIKEGLWDWNTDSLDGITATTALKQTITDINNAPTIEAEPIRHGHWKRVSTDNWSCSNCNSWWYSDEEDFRAEMKYCPNCGTKMDEETDNANK